MDWSYLLALTFKAIKVPSSFSGDVLFFLFLLSLGVSSIKTKNNKGFNFMSISFHELPLPRLAGLYCSGLIAFNERGRLLFEQYRSRRHAISRVLAPSWTDWLVHLAQISSVFLSLGNWYLFCDSRQPQMEHWRVCVYCCLSFFSQFLIQFFFYRETSILSTIIRAVVSPGWTLRFKGTVSLSSQQSVRPGETTARRVHSKIIRYVDI